MTREPSTHLSHYVWIPDTKIRIRRDQSYNELNHLETQRALGRNSNQFMPPPREFMQFYKGIIAAEHNGGRLYDGSNKLLTKKEVNELYERFVLGKQGGVWTHLDAHFLKGSGFNNLDVSTHYRVCHDGNSRIVTHLESPLEECIDSDGPARPVLVSLIFNEQGLPTKKSEYAEWQPRKNIHFWPPQENCSAEFMANVGMVNLECGGNLQDSDPNLGVFACAEGAPRRTK